MALTTLHDLQGYGVAILVGERQQHEDGLPLFNGSGEPKVEPIWTFVFSAHKPDGDRHVVKFTVDKQGKDELVQALTGVQPVATMPEGLVL